jgi:GNAT superfamily N-acetyltransferase
MTSFIFREANPDDIKQIQFVRNVVKENTLSNPNLVTDDDCANYLTVRGKGWVCEQNKTIIGFSIADLVDHNIWALFIHPEFERQGIGTRLHDLMLDWYFKNTKHTVWLSTARGTRAEKFYTKHGWTATGIINNGEIKFVMGYNFWISRKSISNE